VLVTLITAIACSSSDETARAAYAQLDSLLPPLSATTRSCPDSIRTVLRNFDMPPAIRNRRSSIEMINRFSDLGEGPQTAHVWLQIDTLGRVEHVELASATDSEVLNTLLPRFATSLRFHLTCPRDQYQGL